MAFQDSCYQLYTDVKTRTEAADDCKAQGAHLADITSSEENQFVEWLLFKYGVEDAWFGLVKTDVHVWTDGTPLVSMAWHDFLANSNHVCFRLESFNNGRYRWNDWSCTAKYRFVCETGSGKYHLCCNIIIK